MSEHQALTKTDMALSLTKVHAKRTTATTAPIVVLSPANVDSPSAHCSVLFSHSPGALNALADAMAATTAMPPVMAAAGSWRDADELVERAATAR